MLIENFFAVNNKLVGAAAYQPSTLIQHGANYTQPLLLDFPIVFTAKIVRGDLMLALVPGFRSAAYLVIPSFSQQAYPGRRV